MKRNINDFGDEFKQTMLVCKKEEDSALMKLEQIRELLLTLKSNNEKRIGLIKQIRLIKLKEIDEELEKSESRVDELEKEWLDLQGSQNKKGLAKLKKIRDEIPLLIQYINYLKSLKIELCKLFGHDLKFEGFSCDGNEIYKCRCCGMTNRFDEMPKSKYRVVNYRPPNEIDIKDKSYYIIKNHNEELDFSLPTFESYQKENPSMNVEDWEEGVKEERAVKTRKYLSQEQRWNRERENFLANNS